MLFPRARVPRHPRPGTGAIVPSPMPSPIAATVAMITARPKVTARISFTLLDLPLVKAAADKDTGAPAARCLTPSGAPRSLNLQACDFGAHTSSACWPSSARAPSSRKPHRSTRGRRPGPPTPSGTRSSSTASATPTPVTTPSRPTSGGRPRVTRDAIGRWLPGRAPGTRSSPGNGPPGRDFYTAVQTRRYGGDLAGVIEKLEHLGALGVNVLLLSPVFEAPSAFKRDPSFLHHVDNNLGPEPDTDRLVWATENPSDSGDLEVVGRGPPLPAPRAGVPSATDEGRGGSARGLRGPDLLGLP